ncbi:MULTISPECIES: hypothetical protein [Chromobacterium]|nr:MULTISPECIES: hypothetical protein [Chromobacterium]
MERQRAMNLVDDLGEKKMIDANSPLRPLRNAAIVASAHRVAAAVERLTRLGFTVMWVELLEPRQPTIRIEPHPDCRRMAGQGDAAHDDFYSSPKAGRFRINGCLVVWTEY